MPDYKAMYYRLAGKVADAIDLLVKVQQENEEMAISQDDNPIMLENNEREHGV